MAGSFFRHLDNVVVLNEFFGLSLLFALTRSAARNSRQLGQNFVSDVRAPDKSQSALNVEEKEQKSRKKPHFWLCSSQSRRTRWLTFFNFQEKPVKIVHRLSKEPKNQPPKRWEIFSKFFIRLWRNPDPFGLWHWRVCKV